MPEENLTSVEEFVNALETNAGAYEVNLGEGNKKHLSAYYKLVMTWNRRLHLVAPCSATEFATRHVLESLLLLPHLSSNACVIDIGSGAGLPIIPCLIMRPDIRATLFESSAKKSVFLREALRVVGANERASVVAERFEKHLAPEAGFVSCRALDRFTEMFERIVDWSPEDSTLLFFGGHALREKIESNGLNYSLVRVPESEQRFLYVIRKGSNL